MTSAIDPSVIGAGPPVKASVRAQFQTAKDEITALQASVAAIVSPAADIAALQNRASALETRATAIEGVNTTQATAIAATQAIDVTQNTNIATLQTAAAVKAWRQISAATINTAFYGFAVPAGVEEIEVSIANLAVASPDASTRVVMRFSYDGGVTYYGNAGGTLYLNAVEAFDSGTGNITAAWYNHDEMELSSLQYGSQGNFNMRILTGAAARFPSYTTECVYTTYDNTRGWRHKVVGRLQTNGTINYVGLFNIQGKNMTARVIVKGLM